MRNFFSFKFVGLLTTLCLMLTFGMASAQPLNSTKGFLDRVQNGGGTSSTNVPTGVNANPLSDLYTRVSQAGNGGNTDSVFLILEDLLSLAITLITMVAVIFVIAAGMRMVFESNNEETAKKQATTIFNIIAGIVIMNVASFAIKAVSPDTSERNVANLLSLFDSTDGIRTASIDFATRIVFPLLDFALSFLAGIALIYIVYAGLNIIFARGDEEKIKEAWGRIVKTVLGIMVILLNKAFVGVFYGSVPLRVDGSSAGDLKPDLQQGISTAFNIANYFLGFFGLLAMIMLIYAGVQLMISGDDAQKREKAMKTLQLVIIGIVLAMSAYTLTSAIVGVTIGGSL
ncbi:hypothetical protein COW46_03940 [Candidatus Gracilibacteria bacterium CG17_big_fil_post_rev_8_21_14_2_50_48_13]|nr:MAG: hypothetical protein COW46_03940 [Candidatus Gracilibacteria bacterium CG17_big_fil_post_rev_8_21_14_2_50_48_13]